MKKAGRSRRGRGGPHGEGGIKVDSIVVGDVDMSAHELLAAIAIAESIIRSGKGKPEDLTSVREAREALDRHGPDLLTMLLANKRGEPTPGLAAVNLVVQRAAGLIHTQAGIRDHKKRATDPGRAARTAQVGKQPIDIALEKVLGQPPFLGKKPAVGWPKLLLGPVTDQLIADGHEPKRPLTPKRVWQALVRWTGVTKLLKTVPVRRPSPQDFVRVHPSPEYRRNLLCIELKDDRETYLVRPEFASELIGEAVQKTMFTAINRQGVLFLWPVTIPPADGKTNEWWHSAREAAELATTRWIRLRANISLGAYDIYEAEGKISDPEWPNLPYQELLRIAFRDRLVDRLDHPVIHRLRGLG